jgi:hypothetical protein
MLGPPVSAGCCTRPRGAVALRSSTPCTLVRFEAFDADGRRQCPPPRSATPITLSVEKYFYRLRLWLENAPPYPYGQIRPPFAREPERSGPPDRMGIWGTTWTLAWYLRRQPNFRGLAPRPPKKNFEFFFEFLEQIRSRSAVRNEPRHDGSPRSWVLHASPNRLGAGAPQSVNIFPENLEFAEKIHRKHFIFIA